MTHMQDLSMEICAKHVIISNMKYSKTDTGGAVFSPSGYGHQKY